MSYKIFIGCRHNPLLPFIKPCPATSDSIGTRTGPFNYQRSSFFTNPFNSTETKKLTVVPMAADTAIFTSSSIGMLQRITVSVPLIVPDRMENGLVIDLFFSFPANDDQFGRSCSRII